MPRWVAGWLDLRRGFASLAGSLLGSAIAAWRLHSPVAGVGLGLASVIVAAFVINAYRTPQRIEVEDVGSTWGPESPQGNVQVLPAGEP